MSTSVKHEHVVSSVYTPSFCGVVIVLKGSRAHVHVEIEKNGNMEPFNSNFQEHQTTNAGTLTFQLASFF
jgi:hypothetical protein